MPLATYKEKKPKTVLRPKEKARKDELTKILYFFNQVGAPSEKDYENAINEIKELFTPKTK